MTVPPVLSSYPRPEFDIPEVPQKRIWIGWIALSAMLILMISLELVSYLGKDSKPSEKSYSGEILKLKTAFDLKESTLFGKAMSSNSTSLTGSLDDVAREVGKDSTKSLTAAIILSEIRTEQGKPIPDKVLAKLATAKKDVQFAEVYRSKTLTKKQATRLEKDLLKKGFLGRLAASHAWAKAGQKDKLKVGDESAASKKLVAMLALVVILFGGVALLFGYLIAKKTGTLPRKGMPLEHLRPGDADRLAIKAAQYLAAFLALQILVALPVGMLGLDRASAGILMAAAMIASFVWISKQPVLGRTFSLDTMGVNTKDLGKHIVWGVGAAIANFPLVVITGLVGQRLFSFLPEAEHPVNVQIQNGLTPYGILAILVSACIAAPFLEEIMFRGTMMPAMARGLMAPVASILVQGLIFASIHPTGIPAWLALATVGASSGFLSRQTGSLVPSMVMHATHNFGTLLFALTLTG